LIKDAEIGKLIVPIVPDEGRTFGLESAILLPQLCQNWLVAENSMPLAHRRRSRNSVSIRSKTTRRGDELSSK
ncbi:MAG: hypothetical protein WBP63_07525, partial [Silvibacterium sp.]